MKIAIDGTAGSGKGTLSDNLSKVLKLPRLDTGLLYRKVAFSYIRDSFTLAYKVDVSSCVLTVN